MSSRFNILLFIILLCLIIYEVNAHDCSKEGKYYTSEEKKQDENKNYIFNTPTNLRILEEVYAQLKFLALSGCLQDFMERVLTLAKYTKINISSEDIHTFLLYVLDSTKEEDLLKVRDYWLRKLKNDEILMTRPELTTHILVKQNQVNQLIQEDFEQCKATLIKVKKKDTYLHLMNFFGKHDYPGIVSMCIFFFDGLKFERKGFSYEMFSQVLFDRLRREEHYFGLSLRDPVFFEIYD